MCFGSPNALENFLANDRSARLFAAINRISIPVTFPVSMGISLILGTFLSYAVMPGSDLRLVHSPCSFPSSSKVVLLQSRAL